MVIRSHSPLPEFPPAGGPSRRPRRAVVAIAAALLAAAAGFGGDGLVRRQAPLEPASAPAGPASSAPSSFEAPQPDFTIAVDAAPRAAEEEFSARMSARAADEDRADEAVLSLVTFHLAYFDAPPHAPPASETVLIDGVPAQVPVHVFPDSTDMDQHWGFVVRAPRRSAHHRVTFRNNPKSYDWNGVRWTLVK